MFSPVLTTAQPILILPHPSSSCPASASLPHCQILADTILMNKLSKLFYKKSVTGCVTSFKAELELWIPYQPPWAALMEMCRNGCLAAPSEAFLSPAFPSFYNLAPLGHSKWLEKDVLPQLWLDWSEVQTAVLNTQPWDTLILHIKKQTHMDTWQMCGFSLHLYSFMINKWWKCQFMIMIITARF